MIVWIPIVVSLAALGVSGYTLWRTALAGPSVVVVPPARVTLTYDPRSRDPLRPALVVPLLISNKGAGAAYILDIAVEVRASRRSEVFRSLFELLEDKMNVGETLKPLDLTPFQAFAVRPGETVLKRAFLILLDQDSDFSYEAGHFSLTPLTRASHDGDEWRRGTTVSLELEAEDLEALDSTEVQVLPDGGRAVKLMLRTKPTNFRRRTASWHSRR